MLPGFLWTSLPWSSGPGSARGTRKKNKCQKRKKRAKPAVSTCTCQISFCKRHTLIPKCQNTPPIVWKKHHEIVAWFSFLKGSDFGNALKNRFSTWDLAVLLCPAAISTAHMLIIYRFRAIWIDLLINGLQIICVQLVCHREWPWSKCRCSFSWGGNQSGRAEVS